MLGAEMAARQQPALLVEVEVVVLVRVRRPEDLLDLDLWATPKVQCKPSYSGSVASTNKCAG